MANQAAEIEKHEGQRIVFPGMLAGERVGGIRFTDIPIDPELLRANLATFDDDTIPNGLSQSTDNNEVLTRPALASTSDPEMNVNVNMATAPGSQEYKLHSDGIKIIQLQSPSAMDGKVTLLMVGDTLPVEPYQTNGNVQMTRLPTPDPRDDSEIWLPPFSGVDDFGYLPEEDPVSSLSEKVDVALGPPGQMGSGETAKRDNCPAASGEMSAAGKRLHQAAVKIHAVVRITRMQKLKKRARWFTKKAIVFILSHIGLTALVGLYAVAGGFIFQYLENESAFRYQQEMEKVKKMNQERVWGLWNQTTTLYDEQVDSLWNMTMSFNILYPDQWKDMASEQLQAFERRIFEIHRDIMEREWHINKEFNSAHAREWTYASALLFAITIITTIGYGDIVPQTSEAKVVCMIYAVFGIPLTLLCLANIGSFLATIFRFTWKHASHLGHIIARSPARNRSMADTCEVRVPITVSVITMAIYILVGAAIFSRWESWSFLDGSYFCFITLSTIGFGDYVPGEDSETLDSNAKRVVCAAYLLFGLALLSTIFQLIQDSVTVVVRRYASFLGLSKAQIQKDIEESVEGEEGKGERKDNTLSVANMVTATDRDGAGPPTNVLVYPKVGTQTGPVSSQEPRLRFVGAVRGMGKLQRAQTYPPRVPDNKKLPETTLARLLSVPEEELSAQSSTVSLDGSKDSLLGAQGNTDPVSVRNVLCKKYTIGAPPDTQATPTQ